MPNGHIRAAVREGTEAVKEEKAQATDMAENVQKHLQEGQAQAEQVIKKVDQQVRDNPWPVIAGVAIGAFLLGSLINKSK